MPTRSSQIGSVKVTIQGDEALYKAFNLMDDKSRKTGLRKALRRAAKIWVEKAKQKVPVLTGALKKSITAITTIKNSLYGGVGRVRVGPRRVKGEGNQGPGAYGLMVEVGTKHSKPQPYLKPTFEETKDEVLKKFGEELWAEIKKAGK
jgi:HK97 gp10 family phage protein